MTQLPRSSRAARRGPAEGTTTDADALRALVAEQRAATEQLREETAALRREAAELLRRSRWWRDECRRELLRRRRWYVPRSLPPIAELGQDEPGGPPPAR